MIYAKEQVASTLKQVFPYIIVGVGIGAIIHNWIPEEWIGSVLGSGCKSCHQLYENVKKALQNMGVTLEVEYITDMEKIASYGIMRTPALVVNQKVVSTGKVLNPEEIKNILCK